MLAVPLTDYYEEVRRYLTCPEEVKDDLIYDVNRKVMDLNADRPDLDYNGILFGYHHWTPNSFCCG